MQDRLYCRKHNGIARCHSAHVSQRYGEVKSICLKVDADAPKSTPASVSSPVYNTAPVKDTESNMLGSAHGSTTYGM
jgi:hypothetical protein